MIRRKDLQKIVAHYGNIAQVIVLIEEMSELTKAITKAMRGKENKADIAEEIADVQIMLDQAKLIFKINKETMDTFINYKIDRTLERIANESNDNNNPGGQERKLHDQNEEHGDGSGLEESEAKDDPKPGRKRKYRL